MEATLDYSKLGFSTFFFKQTNDSAHLKEEERMLQNLLVSKTEKCGHAQHFNVNVAQEYHIRP